MEKPRTLTGAGLNRVGTGVSSTGCVDEAKDDRDDARHQKRKNSQSAIHTSHA